MENINRRGNPGNTQMNAIEERSVTKLPRATEYARDKEKWTMFVQAIAAHVGPAQLKQTWRVQTSHRRRKKSNLNIYSYYFITKDYFKKKNKYPSKKT